MRYQCVLNIIRTPFINATFSSIYISSLNFICSIWYRVIYIKCKLTIHSFIDFDTVCFATRVSLCKRENIDEGYSLYHKDLKLVLSRICFNRISCRGGEEINLNNLLIITWSESWSTSNFDILWNIKSLRSLFSNPFMWTLKNIEGVPLWSCHIAPIQIAIL